MSGIGIGTVDVTKGIDVSWQVNGDSPMTAYQITIYKNDSNSTQMYTTGEITLGTPFQTHDAQGNPRFFSTTISAATLSSAGIVNGYADGYKIIIKQWWSVNDYVEQSSASVFITRTTPTLSIDAISSPVTVNSLTITATYAQAEGDPISTVEWTFALAGHEDDPIIETGAVNTQILSFDADGLITGNTYSVRCDVVTSSGMEASTGFVQFSVSYPSSSVSTNYQLAQMRNSSAVYLSWDSLESNMLEYPYSDSTKTTNGITFTVNGEGNVSASGTASADAYFNLVSGTLSDIGLTAGQKLLVTSGYSGAKVVVTEKTNSNVVVSTVTGGDPLQYIVPSTANTLTISIVIPSGMVLSTAVTLKPMLYKEDDIVSLDNVTVNLSPIQSLNGYDHPWPAGGGVNLLPPLADGTYEGNGAKAVVVNGVATLSGTTTSSGNAFSIPLLEDFTTPSTTAYIHFLNSAVNASVAPSFEDSANAGSTSVSASFSPANRIYEISASRQGVKWNRVRFYLSSGVTLSGTFSPMVCLDNTARSFSPYSNICPISGRTGLSVYVSPTQDVADATTYTSDWTSSAGTVYGGSLDVVTGVLTVDMKYVDLGTLTWTTGTDSIGLYFKSSLPDAKLIASSTVKANVLCSIYKTVTSSYVDDKQIAQGAGVAKALYIRDTAYSNAPTFTTAMDGVQLVYELATPLTYQLTPQEVAALVGENNVWSDADTVNVTYTNTSGVQTTLSGAVVSFSDSNAKSIPMPVYVPDVSSISIYRYTQGEPVLHHVVDAQTGATELLDYFAPSQQNVSYLIVAHASTDLFMLTSQFAPVFWFYSILLCTQDSDGIYHVSNEYIFKYGVETGAVSNNNSPTIQTNFTRYPTRQPIASLYKTGSVKGYIGTVSDQKLYSDSVSLQNAIYNISTSTLTKFLKTRKGETIMVECSSPIQMQTGDSMVQQPLVATIDWVEVGDVSDKSIVSVPSDGFWPLQ